jgi:tRNA-dihydrouridine synthase 3
MTSQNNRPRHQVLFYQRMKSRPEKLGLEALLLSRKSSKSPSSLEEKSSAEPSRYLIKPGDADHVVTGSLDLNDDAAEGKTGDRAPDGDSRDQTNGNGKKNKKRQKGGQNKEREFGTHQDAIRLCNSVAFSPEFSPRRCPQGERCNSTHDLRKYLSDGRREDLTTWDGICPAFSQYGKCPSGWRCRFLKSHMKEVESADGRKELILVENLPADAPESIEKGQEWTPGVVNIVSWGDKLDLQKRKFDHSKSDQYIAWLEADAKLTHKHFNQKDDDADWLDYRAAYVEPPLKPSEKRRLYFGPETPVLAPLTTQGNLPFRRLCVELGAQATYSEMAFGLPLLQGSKADWTLMRAHESELAPPRITPGAPVVQSYEHAKDLKFGAQISANHPWIAVKVSETLNKLVPHLRLIDLNCGCPIDMVFKSGAGSALLDNQAKLERCVRGMNAVSGDIPITVKIRTGVKDGRPTALKLIDRLTLGNPEFGDLHGPPGCAAITLHGRTRQQRYTKVADWSYIAECAALIKSYNDKSSDLTDTALEPEARDQASGKMYFLGNGDVYSYEEYYTHLDEAKVDSVMIGRGAIVKPWIFEEIEARQYLDKSATERLAYVEKFAKYGLEAWGADEMGIGFTRRFLLEFLSFFYRYVPVGLLEYLPPSLNDRPPAFRGRNELETLLASPNYKDWIKIR